MGPAALLLSKSTGNLLFSDCGSIEHGNGSKVYSITSVGQRVHDRYGTAKYQALGVEMH